MMTNKKAFTRRLGPVLLLFVLSAGAGNGLSASTATQAGGTGRFDIAKVRQASGGETAAAGENIRAKAPAVPSLSAIITRLVLSLAVILFLLFAVVYLFRRLAGQRAPASSRSGMLDILETASIMPGKSLTLVRASDRVLVLGISQEGIQCLSEFEGERALEIIRATDKGNLPRSLPQFAESLNVFLDRFRGKQ